MTSSRFAAGNGARFVGVRLRLPERDCFRSGLASGLLACLDRVGGAFAATATLPSGASSASASESVAVAETGFFRPLPPRLPRRRLFFGPVDELCSSVGSVASCSTCRASGGASSSGAALSCAASSSCCLPKRNQRSAKVEFSSCIRARAPDSHRLDRPRAAWIQDIGRHDLRTGYQPVSDRPRSRASRSRWPQARSACPHCAKALRQPRPGPRLELGVARLALTAGRLEVLEPGVGLFELKKLLGQLRVRHHTHPLDRGAS